jgi:DNA mismatch repair protein MutS2
MGATGRVVRRLPDNRWEVTLGTMRVQVAAEDISAVLPESPTQGQRARPVHGVRENDFGPSKGALERTEINVIGKSREEACEAVDKFLDEAVMSDVERVRIIHGHGMQVLRRELWKMFANHVHVARYYQAEQHEGGAGATIVEVRQ